MTGPNRRAHIRESVELLCHGHGDLVPQVRESNFNELLRIDRAMIVTALSNIARQFDACGVRGLPNVQTVHAARHLTDQYWRQTLRAQLLVHAQEVNLRHLHRLVIHIRHHRDASDQTNQQLVRRRTHSNVPILLISRRSQGPKYTYSPITHPQLNTSAHSPKSRLSKNDHTSKAHHLLQSTHTDFAPLSTYRTHTKEHSIHIVTRTSARRRQSN